MSVFSCPITSWIQYLPVHIYQRWICYFKIKNRTAISFLKNKIKPLFYYKKFINGSCFKLINCIVYNADNILLLKYQMCMEKFVISGNQIVCVLFLIYVFIIIIIN